ncbi:hypothetical protein F4604DRAFT_1904151 [Suillus subluteus]|nr:hypothetical protein F4604DRAFT_1904151 [Suillus subluteus]
MALSEGSTSWSPRFSCYIALTSNRLHGESSPSTPLPGGRVFFNSIRSSLDKWKQKADDVIGVDDGTQPHVLFFCLSWFQKKEKKVQHEGIELKTLASQSQPVA